MKTDGEPSSRDTPTIVKEERREEDDEKTLDKKQSAQVKGMQFMFLIVTIFVRVKPL